MGKLSGRPGRDSDALIEEAGGEAYLEDELERMLSPPARIFTFYPASVRLNEYAAEEQDVMFEIRDKLEPLGINLLVQKAPSENTEPERKRSRWNLRRISRRDVEKAVECNPGQTVDVYAKQIWHDARWNSDKLAAARNKLRVHFYHLRHEKLIKERYNEKGETIYFLFNHNTEKPASPGGQVKGEFDANMLKEENIQDAVRWARMILKDNGLPIDKIENHPDFPEPNFIRHVLVGVLQRATGNPTIITR